MAHVKKMSKRRTKPLVTGKMSLSWSFGTKTNVGLSVINPEENAEGTRDHYYLDMDAEESIHVAVSVAGYLTHTRNTWNSNPDKRTDVEKLRALADAIEQGVVFI